MDLEVLLSSSCRRKILKVLSQVERTNVMDLVCKVNSTYTQVNPNLRILEREGIITDAHLGRIRIIILNEKNEKTSLLLQALRILERTVNDNNRPYEG